MRDVRVAAGNEGPEVTWTTAEGAFLYRIYWGRTPGFEPGPDTYLTYVPARRTVFRDSTNPAQETSFYKVVSVSAEGRTPRTASQDD